MARRALLLAELPLRLKWPTAFLIGSSLVAEDSMRLMPVPIPSVALYFSWAFWKEVMCCFSWCWKILLFS